jgi:hypothetical protein
MPITYHPSAAKLPNGQGFRPIVMLRKDKGQMVGSKTGQDVFTTKDQARNYARNACHAAMATLARDYPTFTIRCA